MRPQSHRDTERHASHPAASGGTAFICSVRSDLRDSVSSMFRAAVKLPDLL